jgi:glycosyltransferase involved in cell wall biosynthesis
VGILELPSVLEPYLQQVEDSGLVSWQDLIEHMSRFDINIAPLALNDLFTDAKSALKYFEPALLGVPTIASPTDDFRISIEHGVTGYLAETEEEWYRYLCLLVTDAEKRHEIGRAAREDALTHYTSAAQAQSTLATYRDLLTDWRTRREQHACT